MLQLRLKFGSNSTRILQELSEIPSSRFFSSIMLACANNCGKGRGRASSEMASPQAHIAQSNALTVHNSPIYKNLTMGS